MQTITILPLHEAQKIAAGEVVERPASVIKELVENSLDARATQINIYLEEAGSKLIRIVDNGCGMSEIDATLCFLPHATSKITSVHDLARLTTFGFRGEALAAIASVSKVTLRTRHEYESAGLGSELTVRDGIISEPKPIACPQGCDFILEDLFYNTPARKKFLKHEETEWNHIQNVVYAFCLSRLDVSFTLYRNEKKVLFAPATPHFHERLSQLFGHQFAHNFLALTSPENKEVAVSGFISNHQFWKYGKTHIFFFVNNRLVKNTELLKGLFKGYGNILPPSRFPAACIFITIDTNAIDINVHPRKEEVLFSKPLVVSNALAAAVKKTLEDHVSEKLSAARPQGELAATFFAKPPFEFLPNSQNYNPLPPVLTPSQPLIQHSLPSSHVFQNSIELPSTSLPPLEHPIISTPTTKPFNLIGTLFATYILIEREGELVIIDQHAAHERILYEEFSSRFNRIEGTRLLFPEIVPLSIHAIELITTHADFFIENGLDITPCSEREVMIKTAPPRLHNQRLSDFVQDCAAFMLEHETPDTELFRKQLTLHVHSHMACKAAVKAGDVLCAEEIRGLIDKLAACNNNHICIHGRPTTWIITQYELEKKFKRKS